MGKAAPAVEGHGAGRRAAPLVPPSSPTRSTRPDALLERGPATRLLAVVRHVGASRELPDLLEQVATLIAEGLGFETAAVNLVQQDGDLSVLAVAGSAAWTRSVPRALFKDRPATSNPRGSPCSAHSRV